MMEDIKYKDFWELIKFLDHNGLLDHVIVVGSWAEYLYAQSGTLDGFISNLRTLDIDLLITNINKPSPNVNITKIMHELGYTIDEDRISGTTKIYTPGFMEIEFLVTQRGSGIKSVLSTNLGVNAQAIRNLNILKDNCILVQVFDFNISVPLPEAYVIHKAIINKERLIKAEKDRDSIKNLLPYINKDTVLRIFEGLTKKTEESNYEFANRISRNKHPLGNHLIIRLKA